MRIRSIIAVCAFALVATACAGTPQASGPSEGIQVHGDWTIDIYNQDGSLDKHVEFENALSDGGSELLVNVLGRQRVSGPWSIVLSGDPRPCINPVGNPSKCVGTEAGSGDVPPGFNYFDTLMVAVDSAALRLTATLYPEVDSELDAVETFLRHCEPDRSPEECFSGSSELTSVFTFKDLTELDIDEDGNPDGPIAISAGQTVQVQVEISFTSG